LPYKIKDTESIGKGQFMTVADKMRLIKFH